MTGKTRGPVVLGCDVSKTEVVVFETRTGTLWRSANDLDALCEKLAPFKGQDVLVVCEATGGYEAPLLAAARAMGLDAHRGDPRRISAFLRSLRPHAKTDPIDARGLARYGEERHDQLARWQIPDEGQKALQDLVRLRADMVADRAGYSRRLKAPGAGPHKPHIQALIQTLAQSIAAITEQIVDLIKADPVLSRRVATITAIPGCGLITAITLCAEMPELGTISRRQAASLSGTAPHPRASGQSNYHQGVRGGRPALKSALFMAALCARRFNPQIRTFADRLAKNGKRPIVVTTAVARKLVTIINAKIRDNLTEGQLS